jgi:CelD/BcsL family acetyltransferase involved in cellulose biosynthesis
MRLLRARSVPLTLRLGEKLRTRPQARARHFLASGGSLRAATQPKPAAHRPGNRRVIPVNENDPRWDAFVRAAPGATAFHHSGWLAALEREYGQRPLRLACEEPDGTLSGVLPLMVTRGLPLRIGGPSAGRRLSSLPRTPITGPLAASAEVLRDLTIQAMTRAGSAGLRLQLKPAGTALDGLLPGLQGDPWRLSYVKELPDDPGQLRFGNSRNHARIEWAVRKAEREGLRVRDAATEADLREWYRLYLDVNRWRGLPSRPYRFFQAAFRQLGQAGHLRLLLACREQSGRDLVVAGAILLMLGETTFYAFNGRMKEALRLRPNDLLQWHGMRAAIAARCRWYDFGEVEEGNEGLAKFKTKWGTETRTLNRYHAPPLPAGGGGYRNAESGGEARSIALRAWRRVPLSVTALAGDGVYRFL